MKRIVKCLFISLVVSCFFCCSARGGEIFRIQRIRVIPNPIKEVIKEEKVLELTFKLLPQEWVAGVGWSLRFYDQAKQLMGTLNTAYFQESNTPKFLLNGDHFKGNNVYTALFPLCPGSVYTVIALGNREEEKIILFPYLGLLQDFNVLKKEILDDIELSGYILIPAPEKVR